MADTKTEIQLLAETSGLDAQTISAAIAMGLTPSEIAGNPTGASEAVSAGNVDVARGGAKLDMAAIAGAASLEIDNVLKNAPLAESDHGENKTPSKLATGGINEKTLEELTEKVPSPA